MNVFKRAFKSIGKALGISGSSSPVTIDPIKQEAEQKRLAQIALNEQTAKTVQAQQQATINPNSLDQTQVASAETNTQANTVLNTKTNALPTNRKWRVLSTYIANQVINKSGPGV